MVKIISSIHESYKHQLGDDDWCRLFEMAAGNVGTQRVQAWLTEQGIHHVNVGVVGVRPMVGNTMLAHAKVVVKHVGSFTHEEPYEDFPSDHFKTKVLLVTGGA